MCDDVWRGSFKLGMSLSLRNHAFAEREWIFFSLQLGNILVIVLYQGSRTLTCLMIFSSFIRVTNSIVENLNITSFRK